MSEIEKASKVILDSNLPISQRMRALFYLKNIKTDESAQILSMVFEDKSVLLKHEAAYVLGQMKLDSSKEVLKNVLKDKNQDEISRHEAGEALGNFLDDETIVEVLKEYINDSSRPVSETCYLAFKKNEEYKILKNKYPEFTDILSSFDSYDPAFPLTGISFDDAKAIFLDEKECLYKRYKALFYFRNLMTAEAVDVLGLGFNTKSELLRHEIAFVFGQMRKAEALKYLANILAIETEHGMVRHECAEALGAIGTDLSYEYLKPYISCKVDVVRESVEVALDIYEYEKGNEAEYAIV